MRESSGETGGAALDGPIPLSARRRRAVTAGVMTGMFLAALEATVVSTAMPTVIATLGGISHYSWVFSAYIITSTVTVPIWGKLSDLYGRRPLFQVGVALFLLGSVLSGLSTSMAQLIAFRAVQGLGAGALIPLGMTIIGDVYTTEERARMQAYFSGVWGVASVIGPLAGGFITDRMSWRWVFYLNVPFGIAAALIIGLALTEPRRQERPSIDYLGALTLTAAITLLMLALVEGGSSLAALASARNLALLGGAALFAVFFLLAERRAADPIVPLDIFRERVVAVAVAAGFLAGVAMFGVTTFVPLFAQGSLGASATAAGTLLTPMLLSWVGLSIVGGRLLLRVGYRTTCVTGFAVLTLGLALLANVGLETPRFWLYFDLALVGSGLGLTMLTLLLAVQQSVPRTRLGVATSLNQFSRSIGGAVGVAVLGAVLSAGLDARLQEAARGGGAGLSAELAAELAADPSALLEPSARAALPPEALRALRGALASSVHNIFWAAAAAALLALLVVTRLPRAGDGGPRPPTPEATSTEAGERLLAAELAPLAPEHQPTASRAD
ncbi:MAG TPA: MDR family MFS transporter [Pyrinomonadaceae bacterium]|nr:MDR family MFS transporter [Pyrinomonadaceae bacterium]